MIISYFIWHYGKGLKTVFRHGVNRVIGFLNYFSVRQHLATLFSPWHRIVESYGRGFDPNTFLAALAGNLISRVLGAIVRGVVIIVGVGVGFLAALAGVLFFLLWLATPFLVPFFFLWGLVTLF